MGTFDFIYTLQHPITNTKKPRKMRDSRLEIVKGNYVLKVLINMSLEILMTPKRYDLQSVLSLFSMR